MIKKIILVALLLLSNFTTYSQEQASYTKALEFYKNGEYQKSIDVLTVLLKEDIPNYQNDYLMGHNYWRMGDFNKCSDHFYSALKLNSNEPNLYVDLIKVYGSTDKFKGALEISEKAIQKFPNHYEVKLIRASILARVGRQAESLKIVEQLKTEKPEDHRTLAIESKIYLILGKIDNAETSLSWALSISPENPYLHNNMAVLFERIARIQVASGKKEEAKNTIKKAESSVKKALELAIDPVFLETQKRILEFTNILSI